MDFMLANPQLKRREIARHFNVGEVWLSIIVNSRMFQARLEEKHEQLFSETVMEIGEQVTGVAAAALSRLGEHVESSVATPEFIRKTANDMLKIMQGPGKGASISVVNNTNNVGQQVNLGTVDREVLAEARALMGKADSDVEAVLPPPQPVPALARSERNEVQEALHQLFEADCAELESARAGDDN